eukprot:SAG22_NODE_2016_length_3134_cov_4.981878_3_plen_194_part_00
MGATGLMSSSRTSSSFRWAWAGSSELVCEGDAWPLCCSSRKSGKQLRKMCQTQHAFRILLQLCSTRQCANSYHVHPVVSNRRMKPRPSLRMDSDEIVLTETGGWEESTGTNSPTMSCTVPGYAKYFYIQLYIAILCIHRLQHTVHYMYCIHHCTAQCIDQSARVVCHIRRVATVERSALLLVPHCPVDLPTAE